MTDSSSSFLLLLLFGESLFAELMADSMCCCCVMIGRRWIRKSLSVDRRSRSEDAFALARYFNSSSYVMSSSVVAVTP